jgi:UDP-N-acetylmuramoylalanine--D-glutamate ligase
MDIAGKKFVIVGLGKTGEALAKFLLPRGAAVTISEIKTEEGLGRKARVWKERGAILETGGHRLETFLASDFIVPSPGAASLPLLQAAEEKGIPVLSEIELAYQFLKGGLVGITGTNGKSTTASLAHKILKEGGLKAYLAGNIGTPLITFVGRSRDDHVYVTEVSSFQLEHVRDFRAGISVFLNISLNHLDWHDSFAAYLGAKKRLVLAQGKRDLAILNRDDRLVWALSEETAATVYSFSIRRAVRRGCFLSDGWIVLSDEEGEKRLMRAGEIPLPGSHNLENVMAASLVGHCLGAAPKSMRASIQGFSGLEHRLEKVLTLRGVGFINDSKATTVDASIKAIQSFDQPVVLILGGRDKGADFRLLRRPVKERVKKVILLGEAREKIGRALRGAAAMESAVSLREAVAKAFASSRPGDIVLLAPACTSFDMFRNFEARGRAYQREVRRLRDRVRGARI